MTRKEQFLVLFLGCSVALGAVALYLREPPELVDTAEKSSRSADSAAQGGKQERDKAPAVTDVTPKTTEAPRGADTSASAQSTPAPPREIAVAVAGGVNSPGLRRLTEGARVDDAIKACGGVSDDADLADVNTAALLIDGTTLTVPLRRMYERQGDTLHIRGAQHAAQLNPPEYTISGSRVRSAGDATGPKNESRAASPGSGQKTEAASKGGKIDLNTASEAELDTLPGIGPKLVQEIVRYRSGARFETVDDLLNVPGIGPKKLDKLRSQVTVAEGKR